MDAALNTYAPDSLRDLSVIVTGAGRGLGRRYAEALGNAGALVVAADINLASVDAVAATIRSNGGQAVAAVVDVSDEASTLALAGAAHAAFGRIDALVNNAGIYPFSPWLEASVELWDRVQAVNVRGTMLCTRAVFPTMQAQGKGKVVNISSGTVLRGEPSGLVHYIASKMAVVGLTRALARELGAHNICVNAISPGMSRADDIPGVQPSDVVLQIEREQCLRGTGRPENLVGAVLFLCSTDSDFVTGQLINVDGGWAFH